MKKLILIIALILSVSIAAQKNVKIELPESYELGNIILALTEYGQTDPYDVQKIPPYYDEIMTYFKPVKDHPLLQKVNYSRSDWKKFLGFRTDFYAFSFDEKGILKRDYPFNSFGPKEVDENIELINDFVKKSNYRAFFKDHQQFYNTLINNYKEYYYINDTYAFLDKIVGKVTAENTKNYVIAISPLVGGQNCHRDINSSLTVDFPDIGEDLIRGNLKNNIARRILDNHTVFSEIDHGYVNPISDQYSKEITAAFNLNNWDKKSGYPGISSFNEYMTWAVYDLFIREKFPKEKTDSLSTIYHKVNIRRGFIAQNLFSEKVIELYKKNKSLEKLYTPLLQWTKKIGPKISQPSVLDANNSDFEKADLNNMVLRFTEPMKKTSTLQLRLFEYIDKKQTSNTIIVVKNPVWSKDGKEVKFKLDTSYKNFELRFYVYNSMSGFYSQKGILLNPDNFLLLTQ
ncbi:DUF4932 domain-containing protein [Chryseobacterium sp. MEBOG06]|uniref:DUF4932 domain-containing protein n=1 Tax=Chryseobacterium sp. MEBOG06 TaxID=2879938 RepID=UPI001F39BD1D|nr:DUF4932 domain-containing protein [Chryseobacterium sp. MEBOG06]UKB82772.1 DUF4932 domain-containing protein [Chryseobacterium sp. MEBOG06]